MDEEKTIGTRRHRNNTGANTSDTHSTAKATRGGQDTDAHTTAKAVRGQGEPQPFEHKTQGVRRPKTVANTQSTGRSQWPDEFVLDNVKYKNDGILSNSSGEAIVFTVSRSDKKYALKIYYYDPDHRPNHKILEKIKALGGSGLVVNIVSHGQWKNPNAGEVNDYELMDFCEGGSLENVNLQGDEKALAEVAVRMGAAIDFLSKHGILHRDIKPANFFYADKARTQIVLADFGISAECPEGGTCKIDEMRSPVYASPEFYTNVPGEPAEVGVESDYFSLGVSLLCLWVGKAKLTANESQLLRSKLNETLPIPRDMSAHTASLIKALTRLKMADRAGFDDIKRWAKGESLGSETAETVNSDFKVIFNSAKSQIAHSPAELAQMLIEDKPLGKKYLYSGRVTRWLEETGRNEIAVNVEEIVEKIYPKNQDAGIMAVAYMLDPAMDYEAPDGTHMTDPAEIARHIFENKEYGEVMKEDSNLMVYLHALKLDRTISTLRDYINSDEFDTGHESLNGYIAAYYLAVLLNKEMPFPVSTEEDFSFADSVAELIDLYRKEGDLDKVNRSLLMSPVFIVWLSYRDPALAGKVRLLHDNETDDIDSIYYLAGSAFRILYELDPRMDYNFNIDEKAPDRIYTIQEIGEYLNGKLNAMVLGQAADNELEYLFEDMDNHPLGSYLRARGEAYMTFLKWNRFCLDSDNEDNIQKAGPYNKVIGAYKSVAGFLGGAPSYPLGTTMLHSLEDVEKAPKTEVASSIGKDKKIEDAREGQPVAWMSAWLTTFFQENPKLDLSNKFTYEKETAKYTEFILKYASDNVAAKRYNTAIQAIDKSAKQLHNSEAGVKRNRISFLLAAGSPTIILLLMMAFVDIPEGNIIKGHYWTVAILTGIAIWLTTPVVKDFVGYTESILPGAVGGLITGGIIYAGFRWFPSVLTLILGVCVIIVTIYALKELFTKDFRVDTDGKTITGKEFEYRQLDALYFAYRQDDNALDNVITKYSSMQRSWNKKARVHINQVGFMWLSVAWSLLCIWIMISPLSSKYSWGNAAAAAFQNTKEVKHQWAVGKWTVKSSAGTVVCNVDTVLEDGTTYGTMVIAGRKAVEANGKVRSEKDTIPESFYFSPADTKVIDMHVTQEVNAHYDELSKKWTVYYYDRKGIMHEASFTGTPLKKVSSPATKKASKKKTESSKSVQTVQPTADALENQPETSGAKEENEPLLGHDTM